MQEIKRFSLVKPTLDTPFHIDFAWWKQHDNNWKVYLQGCLCPEHEEKFKKMGNDTNIDWVDEKTAEIHSIDGLQHIVITHCAKQGGFITDHTTLVDTVFRIFLSNGNQPLDSNQLSAATSRPPETILRTLTGTVIYKGIRPCH